ncbi:tripartite tricarboxylate transporter permease [Rugosimonospora africana]|uniref:Membrane protein n=1 Tax=Rugosimonospora africana TaxID=556532 RepID=A0A8J3QXT4_9ACTN|nr:tripartite tricarboxylate transporter permease [Rugosimonospora africana]GIH17750.1 membrane protein [Rugosimonospora africana]
MLDAFLNSLGNVANGSVLLLMMVGIVIGLLTGLLPGLGGVVVLVLLLPFTLTMSPFEAFALLLSTYAVFSITGDMTSILIGIPAHPECAALVPDGYPMTKRGEAARALGATIFSAAAGAVIGAVMLFLLIPVLRPLVVDIGSPELFAIVLLGLAMVGSLSGKSVLKGIAAACLGMLLASIGTNAQTGIVRYGFGSLSLLEGLSLVAVALGLFALPEIMELHARGKRGVSERPDLSSGVEVGVRDVLSRPSLLLRGSLIGAVMSMLPGLGSAVGQWVAYGQAAQISKHPERFGTGVIEGVIAPASANNSKEAGSLVPTIAVGVPGSAAMAIMLGAFVVVGITPGPSMLGTHLNITYFMIWMLVLANVIGAALSFAFLKPMARISVVPAMTLMPVVSALVIIGSAVSAARWSDVVTLIATGMVAWVMRRAGWSVVPVILGFVLGGNAENFLWISVGTYKLHWLLSPVVDLLFAATILLAVGTAWRKSRSRRRAQATDEGTPAIESVDRAWLWASLAVAAAFTALGAVAVILAWHWPLEARAFPTAVGSLLVVLGLLEVGVEVRALRRSRTDQPVDGEDAGPDVGIVPEPAGVAAPAGTLGSAQPAMAASATGVLDPIPAVAVVPAELPVKRSLAGLGWFVLAAVLSYAVGFLMGLVVFVFGYAMATRRGLLRAVLMAAVVGVVFYVLFVLVLNVAMPIPLIGPSFI